jgi:hypothetical protein
MSEKPEGYEVKWIAVSRTSRHVGEYSPTREEAIKSANWSNVHSAYFDVIPVLVPKPAPKKVNITRWVVCDELGKVLSEPHRDYDSALKIAEVESSLQVVKLTGEAEVEE